jgi:hypothetical protein
MGMPESEIEGRSSVKCGREAFVDDGGGGEVVYGRKDFDRRALNSRSMKLIVSVGRRGV